MSIIRIPSPLRPYTDNLKEVEVNASNVGEALVALTERYPRLKPHLYDENGSLRAYVNIFLQQEDVRNLRRLRVRLQIRSFGEKGLY